jgi:hypothetical protein
MVSAKEHLCSNLSVHVSFPHCLIGLTLATFASAQAGRLDKRRVADLSGALLQGA